MNLQTSHKSSLSFLSPSLIMGLWQAGGKDWGNICLQEIKKAICRAIEIDITTFDTAATYGDGESERILGEIIKPFRQKIIISTKIPPTELTSKRVKKACEDSLCRLQTDVIDVLYIHWPAGSFGTPKIPLEETANAFSKLLKEGKIRAVGCSNFSVERLKRFEKELPVDVIQAPCSLFWRQAETQSMRYAKEHQIPVWIYSPLAQGILAGTFRGLKRPIDGDHRQRHRLFEEHVFPYVEKALEDLQKMADEKKTSLAGLAIAWVLAKSSASAIVGVRNEKQLIECATAKEIILVENDLKKLERISKSVTDHLDNNPIQWRHP